MEDSVKRRFGWRKLVATLAIVSLMTTLAIAAIISLQRASQRSKHADNLKCIGLGLRNIHDRYGHLPPAVRCDELGRPLISWRLQILPHLEAVMIDMDFNKRWDDPDNRWVSTWCIGFYCWLEEPTCAENWPSKIWHTNVVAITGPGTAFDDDRPTRLEEIDPDTILAVEIANSSIGWTEPGDLEIDAIPESIVRGTQGDGVHVLFADGSVWFLAADVPLEDLRKFVTIEGAKKHDREAVLARYASR